MIRKMVQKHGFDKNVRMEVHCNADESTVSAVSEVNGSNNSSTLFPELTSPDGDDAKNAPNSENQIEAQKKFDQVNSSDLNQDLDMGQGVEPPQCCSTPDDLPSRTELNSKTTVSDIKNNYLL